MTARIATVSLPGVLLVSLAWTSGGYFPRTWGWVLLVEAVAIAVFAIVATRVSLGRLGGTLVAALFALALWQLLSRAWTVAPDAAVLELERTLLYAGAALAALLLVPRHRAPHLVLGVLAGTTVVTVGALVTHLVEGMPTGRLEEPIGYANAAGITAATALLLGIRLALDGRGWRRLLAALTVAPAATALALAFSRGALVAFAAGALVLLLSRRGRATGGVSPGRSRARRLAIVVTALVALGTVTVYEITTKSTPAKQQGAPERLLSATSDRAAYWDVAAGMVAREPLVGEGAGAFERIWLRERPALIYVRDAHSLYLETLAELGPVGLAALLVALGAPLVAARRIAATPHGGAAAAAYVALVVHAGLDWDWELPVVMLAVSLLGVALVAAGDETPRRPLRPSLRAGTLVGAATFGAIAIVAHVGNGATEEAHRALDRNDAAAARTAALRARRFVPWAAEPWQLLGEAELLRGRVASGAAHLVRATREDPGSWTAWLALAFATAGDERAEALGRARALNPLAPEIDLARAVP